MKLRPPIITLVLLAILGGGFLYFYFYPNEPRYDGRPLSHWLKEIEIGPAGGERWRVAAHAVRQIGSNAIPALLKMLQAPDSRWKAEAVDWLQENAEVDLSEALESIWCRRALGGFRQLGPQAVPAIPHLATLTRDADQRICVQALTALGEIGGPEVVPALTPVLRGTNTTLRAPAANALGALRAQGQTAVPALIDALANDPDYMVRASAARAVGEITLDADRAVPALTRALEDTNSTVRAAAALGLGYFGDHAAGAQSALRQMMMASSDEAATRLAPRALVRLQCEMRDGAIIRGPKTSKRIAFVFTAHEFGEGAPTILDALDRHQGKASFFLTGVFLTNRAFTKINDRLDADGHLVSPHSDRHLLYCSWEDRRTLITEVEFVTDLTENASKIARATGTERRFGRYFLPPFEHYNREIADWTRKQRWTLINFTPGTRSNADYTGDADKNFVSSQTIFDSIVKREREDPSGLNGFLLLLHLGSGPGRADKFPSRFGELLDHLAGKGYEFVRVDQLLGPPPQMPK